jgi:hypothetical protein
MPFDPPCCSNQKWLTLILPLVALWLSGCCTLGPAPIPLAPTNPPFITRAWTVPVSLATYSPAVTGDTSKIIGDGNGDVAVLWTEVVVDGGRTFYRIMAASYALAKGTFGAPQMVVNTTNTIGSSDWAMDAHGNIVLVWADSFQDAIFANRYDASTRKWGGTARGLAHPVGGSSVRVAITPDGNALAVWAAGTSSLGPGNYIDASRYFTATDNWSGAPTVLAVTKPASQLEIAMDANGNAFVQWEQTNAQGIRSVYQDCFNAVTGKWGSSNTLSLTRYGEGRYPDGVMDAAGNSLVAWSQAFAAVTIGAPSIVLGVAAQRYNRALGTWDSWQRIDNATIETSLGGSYLPQVVTADNTGDAIAVWWYSDGSSFVQGTVQFRQYSAADDAWTLGSRLDNSTGSGPDPFHIKGTVLPFPSVAMAPDGEAVVVWMQAEGIYANNRSHNGTWSTPQQIEQLTASPTVGAHPTVTIDSQGNATVSWIEPSSNESSVMVARYQSTLI